jgi:hypothetical protein
MGTENEDKDLLSPFFVSLGFALSSMATKKAPPVRAGLFESGL